MNDTVTRLMALADKAIAAQDQRLGYLAQDYRQALQDELTKLFEPAVEPATRIALNDGNYLSSEPCYFLDPVWMLYTENGKQIRFLDEHESEFVNAALKASTNLGTL